MAFTDIQLATRYTLLYLKARKRRIPCDLSLKHYKKLMVQKRCSYTGIEFSSVVGHPHYRTIDRMDASEGYTDKNTVACIDELNQKKRDLTIKDIETILILFRRKKVTKK